MFYLQSQGLKRKEFFTSVCVCVAAQLHVFNIVKGINTIQQKKSAVVVYVVFVPLPLLCVAVSFAVIL